MTFFLPRQLERVNVWSIHASLL